MPAYYSNYWNKPSCVYRLYDDADVLLYVGLAVRPDNRVVRHRRAAWGHQIVRVEVEWFDNREAAKAGERSAIHHENPLHNITRPKMGCC